MGPVFFVPLAKSKIKHKYQVLKTCKCLSKVFADNPK